MAKCEEGYLCDVCGGDVEEITDSDLYLRYVIGQLEPSVAGKARVLIKDKSPDKGDLLVWKWIKGEATTLPDFGDPTLTDSYTLWLRMLIGVGIAGIVLFVYAVKAIREPIPG